MNIATEWSCVKYLLAPLAFLCYAISMDIIAHRGMSGTYPENTMLAFRKAYEAGADGIELDVHLSKDGEVMIMHDESLERTTGVGKLLAECTRAELERINAGKTKDDSFGFTPIPSLEEYLSWVKDTGLYTNIELKTAPLYYPGIEEKTLDLIGRKHTAEQIKEAFHMAREAGFDNINMDLIVGLPGEGIEDVRHTMEELRALDPDSITVHSLAVKRAARLKLFRDTYEEMGFQNSQEIMDLTYRYCVEQGAYPYYLYRQKNMAGNFENVGYAKDRKAGIYNILIMEEKQTILAAGAGASSKFVFAADHIERVENVKDVAQYIDRIDEMIERKRSFMEAHGLLEQS